MLYAHYGQENDFRLLRDKNINMSGRVILVRAGKISFAEKVGGIKPDTSNNLVYFLTKNPCHFVLHHI